MEKNNLPIILIGGVVAIGLIYVVLSQTQTSSSGFSVLQADPTSVQAVETANAANTATQAQVQEAGITASSTNLGNILGYFTQESNNATSAAVSANTNATNSTINAQNVGGAVNIGQIQAAAANFAASANDAAQLAGIQSVAGSQQQIASVNASAQQAESLNAANAQIGVAQAQTTAEVSAANSAESASKTASTTGLIGNVIKGAASLFGFSPTALSTFGTNATDGTTATQWADAFPSLYPSTTATSAASPDLSNTSISDWGDSSSSITAVPYQVLSGGNYAT